MSCGVGCRRVSDPVLLWLWYRPAATALIEPLAWEPPYTAGATLKKKKRKKKKGKLGRFQKASITFSGNAFLTGSRPSRVHGSLETGRLLWPFFIKRAVLRTRLGLEHSRWKWMGRARSSHPQDTPSLLQTGDSNPL